MSFLANSIIYLLLLSLPSPGEAPKYSVKGDVKNADEMISYIYNVPEKVIKKVNDFGAEVVFLDKAYDPRVPEKDKKLLEAARAIYVFEQRMAFIVKNNKSCDAIKGMPVPQLHEYGHIVDHAFGYLSKKVRSLL
ncbi:MAG: hypothetical protein WC613_02610 [Candidatus Aenigmatarchaeota archaeon]